MYPRLAWTSSPLCLPFPNAWIDRLWGANTPQPINSTVCSAEQSYETASTGEQHTSLLLQVKGDDHFLLECSLAFSRSSDPCVSESHVHQTKITVENMPQVHLAQTFLLYTQLQILFSFKEYGFQKQPSQVCVPKGERYNSCLMSNSVLPNQSILTFKYRVICTRSHTENHNIGKWFLL